MHSSSTAAPCVHSPGPGRWYGRERHLFWLERLSGEGITERGRDSPSALGLCQDEAMGRRDLTSETCLRIKRASSHRVRMSLFGLRFAVLLDCSKSSSLSINRLPQRHKAAWDCEHPSPASISSVWRAALAPAPLPAARSGPPGPPAPHRGRVLPGHHHSAQSGQHTRTYSSYM